MFGSDDYSSDAFRIAAPAYSGIISYNFSDEATEEPVGLAQAKRWLRISPSETTFDDDIQIIITASRQAIEQYLNSSLIKRTVTVSINIAPGGAVLPFTPILSFTSASDKDGNVIDNTTYSLKGSLLNLGNYNQAVLVYDAGYNSAADVPVVFKNGILRLVAFDWENRGDVSATRKIGDITGLKAYRRVY